MNKKQGVIIVTLLALIICTGVLATKLNSPLYVNGADEGSTVSFNNTSKSSNKTESKEIANQTFLQKQNLLEIKKQLKHYKH